jgi:hypothetical protein
MRRTAALGRAVMEITGLVSGRDAFQGKKGINWTARRTRLFLG